MSNNNDRKYEWDSEEEEDDDSYASFDSDTDLVKKLRKALKAEQKRNKELETNYSELTKSQKERILKDVLASRGVNPKIAQFIPSDIEASEDAIGAWLDSNGDVFGYTPTEKPKVAQQDIAAMQRMDSALTGAETPSSSDDLANRIANAGSEDEILSILSGN
jgi:hypothetical protein